MMAATELPRLRGELKYDEPMSRHTTWRVGGPADRLYRPADLTDLQVFLAGLPADEPLFWLGLGSNLLVRDGGIRGTVILTAQGMGGLTREGSQVRAEAGVACARIAKFCVQRDLLGAEFLAGIPGTLGGALAMNAGAFGGETWERVASVETIDRGGTVRTRTPDEYEIGYRHLSGPAEEWFLAATLQLEGGDGAAAGERVKAMLAKRSATQPVGKPSCGSVFRNPPGDHAARLIEAAGLKGLRIGGAVVSEKHANFIINSGDATAADIEALMLRVQAVVAERFGVQLQAEARIVGEGKR
jgi:UDP-N-acetylmuramate dehydrogenase